jgi:hypothetical protein
MEWPICGVMRGATAYEWQIGPLYGGINRPRFFSLRHPGMIGWSRDYFNAE